MGFESRSLLDTVFHVEYASDNVVERKVDFVGEFYRIDFKFKRFRYIWLEVCRIQ